METRRKSPATRGKIKKKMTKEQMQLAILWKKECDAKALKIVERLLEPDLDPDWLIKNLKDINKCHMEDVIEERAIVKLCGYVLCQKPLTLVYSQRYHISLKDKKVYDVTKRKNFCSSSCFGASNYLLEQMLTSPLWLRDDQEIPKFRIFYTEKQESKSPSASTRGEEINIAAFRSTDKQGATQKKESTFNENGQLKREEAQVQAEKEMSGCVENFVLEAVQNFELKDINSTLDKTLQEELEANGESRAHAQNYEEDVIMKSSQIRMINKADMMAKEDESRFVDDDDDDIIEQCSYPIENYENDLNNKSFNKLKKNHLESEDMIEQSSYPVNEKYNTSSPDMDDQSPSNKIVAQEVQIGKLDPTSKATKNKIEKTCKRPLDINLAARVEESFNEWVTRETLDYLFGDESVKKKVINNIEIQENHRILCGKLDRLQVQEEREDAEILGRTALKPAPHFAVLKEEGQKLDLKVRAFLEGKTTFQEPPKSNVDEAAEILDTFLPLTDIHGPQILRRKIFLEKLDQVLPDLLRTLAGNKDVYARASSNYSSMKCMAVKALVHTFSLSAKNIIFKTAEWTLVGLVIIKMLSLSDPYLAGLLATKQANLYVSMILTAYKLDSDYLSLLVASFNPNMNPR